jgi:hypothetical protein
MTLEEIKALVYPTEEVNWIEVLRDLVKIKFGEKKMMEFKTKKGYFEHIYLYSVGDPNEYLIGVVVINDVLFAMTDDGDGNDVEFGTAWFGDDVRYSEGIGLTKDAIIKACKTILEGRTEEVLDFNNTKDCDYWYEEYFLPKIEQDKEKFDSFVSGESKGYLSIT